MLPPPENFLEPPGAAPSSTSGQAFNSKDDDNDKNEKKSFLFHSLLSFSVFYIFSVTKTEQ